MVSRPRIRSIVTAICLHSLAALVIGYFAFHAFTGNHGIKARETLDQQFAALSAELKVVKAERQKWQQRVSLLRSDKLDPDLLDEEARTLLDYVDPRDVVIMT
ncbi:MAG: septum formation initiator family protein, partial [Methylobacteriaceae bacterium]|nr:septum formation initiator family protein [Methylobacteriaceae bacterium]